MERQERELRALERLQSINWIFDDSRLRSHLALLVEYLRRAALWAKTLQVTELWPFFDVAACVSPRTTTRDEIVNELRRSLKKAGMSMLVGDTCEWYLHWQAIDGEAVGAKHRLPDPFEPLILLYERGGYFSRNHEVRFFIDIGVASINVQGLDKFDNVDQRLDLDAASLDQLDTV